MCCNLFLCSLEGIDSVGRGNLLVETLGVSIGHHSVAEEVIEPWRWLILELCRLVDDIDYSENSSENVLGSLLTLLGSNQLKIATEELLECLDNWVHE